MASIIVPVRNGETYLGRALDSVIEAAGNCSYEVIVQDSLSTDGTPGIASGHPGNMMYVRERDAGQSDGLNRGLSKAKGEIVGWLNCDDLYLPGAISTAVELFSADSSVDVVYGDFIVIDGESHVLREYKSSEWSWDRLYRKGNYIFTGATFFHQRVFERFGNFSTRYDYVMDLEFFLRVGAGVRAIHSGRAFAAYRYHPGSKSARRPFQFCREAAQLRRSYLAQSPAGIRGYLAAQAELWLGATTARLRWSRPYSSIRHRKVL